MTDEQLHGGMGGQVAGPEDGASDNATANAAPEVAHDVLGVGAEDDVTDADLGLEDGDDVRPGSPGPGPGEITQPRTGAETPVDAEDLVHAQGQDVTPVTLAAAEERLAEEGPAAVEDVLPPLPETD